MYTFGAPRRALSGAAVSLLSENLASGSEDVVVVFSRLFRRQTDPEPKIEAGLKKSRRGIFKDISALFERSEITEDLFEDLEALLIQADLGV